MKMSFYVKEGRRLFAGLVLAFLSTLSLWAGDEKYYYFYATAEPAPTGAGKVYLANSSQEQDIPYEDVEVEIKLTQKGLESWTVYGYAEPAEGYLFAGWGTTTDKVEVMDNPGGLTIESHTNTEDEPDEFGYPLEPDATWKALFTRVKVSYMSGQSSLGEIVCSKPCNEIGDEVVLTATPADEQSRFLYWTLNGEKITDNPLTVKVTGPADYVAHFESDHALILNFPEEGGYLPFSYPYTAYVPSAVEVHSVLCDSLAKNPVQKDKVVTFISSYMVPAGDGVLFYGAGEQTFILEEPDEWTSAQASNLIKASGAEGTDIASLPQEGYRYFTYEDGKFVHTTTAVVAPNSIYLAVPDSCGVTEDVLTVVSGRDVEDGDGINEVLAGKDGAKVSGIYDLSGRRVALPAKDGIYIIDGKKVLFRKK